MRQANLFRYLTTLFQLQRLVIHIYQMKLEEKHELQIGLCKLGDGRGLFLVNCHHLLGETE
jgi:hypothetical protein